MDLLVLTSGALMYSVLSVPDNREEHHLVLAASDEPTLRRLKNTVEARHERTHRWSNRKLAFKQIHREHNVYQLKVRDDDSSIISSGGGDPMVWRPVALDLYDTTHTNFLDYLNIMCNSRIFIVKDLMMLDDDEVLTLNGVLLPGASSKAKSEFDPKLFLENWL